MSLILRRQYATHFDLKALRLQLVEMMCLWELYVPATEHAVTFHLLLHLVDAMKLWGSVQNFWMFSFERYVLGGFFSSTTTRQCCAVATLGTCVDR